MTHDALHREESPRPKPERLAQRCEALYAKLDTAENQSDDPTLLATLETQALEAADELLALVGAVEANRLRNRAWRAMHSEEA